MNTISLFVFLQGFGSQEGYPLIENDLMFYVEVIKFQASYHEHHDLVTLKRKISSILDCFIDSELQPSLKVGSSFTGKTWIQSNGL